MYEDPLGTLLYEAKLAINELIHLGTRFSQTLS